MSWWGCLGPAGYQVGKSDSLLVLLFLLFLKIVVVVVVVVFEGSLLSLLFLVVGTEIVNCKTRPGLVFVESRRDAFNFRISLEKLLDREMLASGR